MHGVTTEIASCRRPFTILTELSVLSRKENEKNRTKQEARGKKPLRV